MAQSVSVAKKVVLASEVCLVGHLWDSGCCIAKMECAPEVEKEKCGSHAGVVAVGSCQAL